LLCVSRRLRERALFNGGRARGVAARPSVNRMTWWFHHQECDHSGCAALNGANMRGVLRSGRKKGPSSWWSSEEVLQPGVGLCWGVLTRRRLVMRVTSSSRLLVDVMSNRTLCCYRLSIPRACPYGHIVLIILLYGHVVESILQSGMQ
jgi:hypothetical protein